MRRIFLFLFILLCSNRFVANAQIDSAKIPRVLILLDGSSSMSEQWGGGNTRFQQAGVFILALIDSFQRANEQVEFGLRVFGHQYPAQQKNCYDTKREIMFSRHNVTQMQARLEDLHGYGVSPIAYSLSEAAMEDFENENKYAYSIILVTDGGESCDGDICKVVNDLLQRKIFFRPYIVSLVDYAPLKDLYKCLGTFLTVSKQPEMAPTITKIVEAYREGFVRAKTGKVIPVLDVPKKKDTIVTPIVKKEVIPAKVDTIVIPITIKKEVPAKKADTIVIPVPVKKDEPKIIKAEPVKKVEIPAQIRDKKEVNSLQLATKFKVYKTIYQTPSFPKFLNVPMFKQSTIGDEPPAPPKPIERAPLKSVGAVPFSKPKIPKYNSLVVLPTPKKVNVPDFVLSKIAPPPAPETTAVVKPVVKPVIKPVVKPTVKPTVKKAEENNYTNEKTPASETFVEVYFTDGNGKFYTTSPQIMLSEPNTNKPVKAFYRMVNPEGNPDPAPVPAGTYNLSVVGSDKTFLKNVTIEENMTNKIVITVSSGSLQFVWDGGRVDKSVDKYLAIVKRNFVPQPVVRQPCDTVLPYPPGNYHIDINTLPPTMHSVDLSFGTTIVIGIPRPGTVQITNTNRIGRVYFFYPRGDRFERFYQMDISGNPGAQKEEFKPGIYEVHYSLAPGLPQKTLTFHIKSDETISIELQ